MSLVDPAEELAEWCGIVPCECPEHAAGGKPTTEAGKERGKEDDEQEAEGPTSGAGGLAVDSCKREEEGALKYCVEVGNGVEDGDHVEEGREEAHDVLSENGAGDVGARSRVAMSKQFKSLMNWDTYLGISSAR